LFFSFYQISHQKKKKKRRKKNKISEPKPGCCDLRARKHRSHSNIVCIKKRSVGALSSCLGRYQRGTTNLNQCRKHPESEDPPYTHRSRQKYTLSSYYRLGADSLSQVASSASKQKHLAKHTHWSCNSPRRSTGHRLLP
jgi:hypothetical protein